MKQDECSTSKPDAGKTGPTKDRASSPSQLNWNLYAGAIINSEAWSPGVQEGGKVVNRDWVNHQACSLFISDYFITNDYFLKSEKSFWLTICLNLYTNSS